MGHTPTPYTYCKAIILGSSVMQWVIEDADREHTICGQILKEENAAFIVKAVNCHEELVKALEAAEADLIHAQKVIGGESVALSLVHKSLSMVRE